MGGWVGEWVWMGGGGRLFECLSKGEGVRCSHNCTSQKHACVRVYWGKGRGGRKGKRRERKSVCVLCVCVREQARKREGDR